MRIVLATPLYPPEIAEPAPYVKELAKRLGKLHEVTVVAYARLPEKVPGVRIVEVDKHHSLPVRLFSYFFALRGVARHADIVYAMNGASVELPAAFVATLSRVPLIFCIADPAAHTRAQSRVLLRLIERFVSARAKHVITDLPCPRPEILPLEPYPEKEMTAYEASWTAHLSTIERILTYGT